MVLQLAFLILAGRLCQLVSCGFLQVFLLLVLELLGEVDDAVKRGEQLVGQGVRQLAIVGGPRHQPLLLDHVIDVAKGDKARFCLLEGQHFYPNLNDEFFFYLRAA